MICLREKKFSAKQGNSLWVQPLGSQRAQGRVRSRLHPWSGDSLVSGGHTCFWSSVFSRGGIVCKTALGLAHWWDTETSDTLRQGSWVSGPCGPRRSKGHRTAGHHRRQLESLTGGLAVPLDHIWLGDLAVGTGHLRCRLLHVTRLPFSVCFFFLSRLPHCLSP